MKIGVLSLGPQLYSTRRLIEAGAQRDHEMSVINYLRCYMDITARRPMVMYQGRRLSDLDAVIPRIGASRTFYGTSVVRQFEMMNVFTAVESQALSRSRDKLRSLQILARAGVDMPVTSFAHHTQDSRDLIEIVGGAPLVIKILEGTQGLGVVLAETEQAAQSVIEAFRGLDANILVQEFVEEAKGEDVRAFVVGRKVVAAMRRQAPEGEFRSNLHRGAVAESTELSAAERRTALKAGVHAGAGDRRGGHASVVARAAGPRGEFFARPRGNRGSLRASTSRARSFVTSRRTPDRSRNRRGTRY